MKLFTTLLLCTILLVFLLPLTVFSQSLAINTDGAVADSSAILDVKSSSKGMLIPRTSTVSRIGIVNPANGLILYDSTTSTFWFYNGAAWNEITTGITNWSLTGNAGTDTAINFIGTIDNLPLRFRLNNIWAGELNAENKNYFIGDSAGMATTGVKNVGIGSRTLFNNTTGSWNTAIGTNALYSNTTANYNTAFGFSVLDSNTIGGQNVAFGALALRNNKTGWNNSATGLNALFNNINGNGNTANGSHALFKNTTGGNNTAIGLAALNDNTSGFLNTAIGSYAHFSSKYGVGNTSIGANALTYDSTGNDNTAIGFNSLYYNANSNFNIAIGNYSLYNHRKNHYNTAIGGYALYLDTSGTSNTAVGYGSLFENKNGIQNTAVGQGALYFSKANNNTAVGYGALSAITTGYQNIAIGSGSGTHPATPAIYNTISIGNDGYLNAFQNQAFIGNVSTAWIGGQVNWSTFSDSRIKTAVAEDVKGLDFITRLRPVSYYKNFAAITDITGNKETENFPGKYDGEQIKYSGFIAQEVENAAKQSNYNFSGLHIPKSRFDLYSLSYAEFVVPLVKAVQEQQAMIKSQQKIMEEQQKKLELFEKRLDALDLKNK